MGPLVRANKPPETWGIVAAASALPHIRTYLFALRPSPMPRTQEGALSIYPHFLLGSLPPTSKCQPDHACAPDGVSGVPRSLGASFSISSSPSQFSMWGSFQGPSPLLHILS